MPIKRWASGFTSTVYKALYGNHLLKQIYYGRQLVFDAGSDFNYFDITPGTKTITIPTRAVYNIQLVGGGGGGSWTAFDYGGYWWSYGSSGGSGSYVYGWMELEAGTYPITVGGGGSGYSAYYSSGAGGTGGTSTAFGESANGGTGGNGSTHGTGGTAAPNVLSGQNGNNGVDRGTSVGAVSAPNVASPYDNNVDGIGHGGGTGGAGGNGLVAVSYLSPPLSPMFSSDTPGTYTITIPITALYEIVVVGAGGGGAAQGDKYTWKSSSAGGGSGAYVKGTIKLIAGSQYQVVVGAGGEGHGGGWTQQGDAGGSSSFDALISCTGGGGGYAAFTDGTPAETGGAGGTYSVQDGITVLANINGNTGGITTDIISTEAQGGASVYNGYGKGGNARATGHNAGYGNPGGNGFVSIRQLSGTAPTTFTVNVNPSDATVNFSAIPVDGILARNGNTVTAYPGTQITYTITRSEYTTHTETITLISQTTKNITMVPRRTIAVTSTSNPISSAQYKINNGDWQTLTLTNNLGTIICDDGDDLLVSAQGGNYNEEDEAKQGTVYSKRIRTIAGDDTLTFNFAYEAWDEVKYCACRSAAGIGSNLAFIALDESYISYSTANNFKYLDIVYDNISIEGETFNNVPSYRFLVKHGTSFTFGLEIPDHRYSVESANATIQYTPGESYYVGPTWTSFFAVDTITIALTEDIATISDLSTPIYTRQGNSIRVMRGQTLRYTLYKDGHTHTDSYTNYELLPAPATETIIIDPTTFLGYTITFDITPADATLAINGATLSGNTYYWYKDNPGDINYTVSKNGYNTINGTIIHSQIFTKTIVITMEKSTVSRYVAINTTKASGTNGCWWSEDAINWNYVSTPSTTEQFTSPFYANGTFIAFSAADSKLIRSTDGINWTQHTPPLKFGYSFTIDNKFYAYYGYNGNIGQYGDDYTYSGVSSDGLNWTTKTTTGIALNTTNHWIINSGRRFAYYYKSSDDYIAYSDDGLTWAATGAGFAYGPMVSTWHDGICLQIMGLNSTRTLRRSTNGTSFTDIRSASVSGDYTPQILFWLENDNKFYQSFELGTGTSWTFYTSTDGLNWSTKVINHPFGSGTTFSQLFWGKDKYILTGQANYVVKVSTSTDLINWTTPITVPGSSQNQIMSTITYGEVNV